jgi:hypothetical protein
LQDHRVTPNLLAADLHGSFVGARRGRVQSQAKALPKFMAQRFRSVAMWHCRPERMMPRAPSTAFEASGQPTRRVIAEGFSFCGR